MSCTPHCKVPSPSQAHCSARDCHRTFSGVGTFDRHRRDGACVDPASIGFVERDRVWRHPVSPADAERLAKLRHREERVDESLPPQPSTPEG